MAFRNYDEFPAPKPVELPIGEKVYSFPGAISARAWLLIERLGRIWQARQRGEDMDLDEEVLSDAEHADLSAEVFGDTKREMIDDGLTSEHVKRAFMTLVVYHLNGREAAEAVWNQGEAPAPNRAQRRAKAPSAQSRGNQGSSRQQKPARPGAPSSGAGT